MVDVTPNFAVDANQDGEATLFSVRASDGYSRNYRVGGGEHGDHLRFFADLAGDFGTRVPGAHDFPSAEMGEAKWQPLITKNLSERSLYGYGDPAVSKVDDGWILPRRPTMRTTPFRSCTPAT